jgi:hypothetical protein
MALTNAPAKPATRFKRAFHAVVTVGHGRGFVVEGRGLYGRRHKYIVTAAHCLPFKPPRQGASYLHERTYPKLLARLGKRPTVWCECLFLDPIADIAVLGAPDDQALNKQAVVYEKLVAAATPLVVAEPPSQPIPEKVEKLADLEKRIGQTGKVQWAERQCPAFLLSLENQWFPCKVRHSPNDMLWISDAAEGIAGGMSGSPIVAKDGTAIGIVCLGSGGTYNRLPTKGGPNPRLMGNLPGWFLKVLTDGAAQRDGGR